MIALMLLLALGARCGLYIVLRRIAFLEEELRRVEIADRPARPGRARNAGLLARAPRPCRLPRPIRPPQSLRHRRAPSRERRPVEPRPLPQFSFETLIGGRLPIWIGGAALVLAGFFLVRYSIESGLLGPGTRTLLAALFGARAGRGQRDRAAPACDRRRSARGAGAGRAQESRALRHALHGCRALSPDHAPHRVPAGAGRHRRRAHPGAAPRAAHCGDGADRWFRRAPGRRLRCWPGSARCSSISRCSLPPCSGWPTHRGWAGWR